MKTITLIDFFNQFWSFNSDKSFTPSEAYLYFYLLSIWNKSGRKDEFNCNTSDIIRVLNITKPTLVDCRKRLQNKGLIKFKEGNRKSLSPCYKLFYFTNDFTNDFTTHRVIRDKEKETSSNEEVKKELKEKTRSSVKDLPDCEIIDEAKNERMDWVAFKKTFNESLGEYIPKVIDLKQTRRDAVKARIKEFGKESIMQVFDKIKKSDYLTGRKRKPNDTWKCNFDFIFSKSGFIKILEGNYDNNGASINQNCGGNNINSGAVQDKPINIYKEVFGYDGAPENFEEWFNKHPYGS